jgi:LCP family protein required for cell wall assembly
LSIRAPRSRQTLSAQRLSRDTATLKEFKKGQAPAKRKKRIIITVVAAVAALLIIAAAAIYLYFQHIQSNISLDPTDEKALEAVLADADMNQPFYMLLVGSDSRVAGNPNAGARSDTIILTRVDPVNRKVTLLSIPRDTKVQLPGHGTQKINAAFAFGSAAGIVTAVDNLCDVRISHYVQIDFDGLQNLVNDIGGLDVNVSEAALPEIWAGHPRGTDANGTYGLTKDPKNVKIYRGMQHMDGFTAMAFARCRQYPMPDIQRTANQRQIIQLIAKKVLSQNIVALPGSIDSLSKCVQTDIPASDLASLALKFQGIDSNADIYSAVMPWTVDPDRSVSYLDVDQTKLQAMMQRIAAGQDPNATPAATTD